jgi:O-antigen/teichoic acid export membrane protein
MSLANKSFSIFKREIFLFISGVITSSVIARNLGPEIMGVWIIISLISSYAEAFGRLKFDIAAVYFLGKNLYGEREMVITLNTVAMVMAMIIAIPLIVWSVPIYTLLFDNKLTYLFFYYLIIIQIPVSFLFMNYSYLLVYKEDTIGYNVMTMIRALISSVGSILLITVFGLKLEAVLFASILSVSIGLIYGYFKLKVDVDRDARFFNPVLIMALLKYAYKMYLTGIISHLNVYLMRTLLSSSLSPSKISFFSLAQDRATMINKVPDSINLMLYSRLSKQNGPITGAEMTAKIFRIVFIILIVATIILLILIKPIVYILYGIEYYPMLIPFMIILPGLSIAGATSILLQYFNSIGKPEYHTWMTFLSLIVQIGLGYILINQYEIIGASISFTLSMILYSLGIIFFFIKTSGFNSSMLFLKMSDFSHLKLLIKQVIFKSVN